MFGDFVIPWREGHAMGISEFVLFILQTHVQIFCVSTFVSEVGVTIALRTVTKDTYSGEL